MGHQERLNRFCQSLRMLSHENRIDAKRFARRVLSHMVSHDDCCLFWEQSNIKHSCYSSSSISSPRVWCVLYMLFTINHFVLPFSSSAIPTVVNGGNHTRDFAASAATVEAHYATLDVSKALAAAGMRVLTDEKFFAEVSDDLFITITGQLRALRLQLLGSKNFWGRYEKV